MSSPLNYELAIMNPTGTKLTNFDYLYASDVQLIIQEKEPSSTTELLSQWQLTEHLQSASLMQMQNTVLTYKLIMLRMAVAQRAERFQSIIMQAVRG